MKKIVSSIPNFITSLNIVCGSIAIVLALESHHYLQISALFLGLAAIFDFCDGLAARLLKAYSPLGKELDSLADMISFGLAPGVILYQLMKISLFTENFSFCFCKLDIVSVLFLMSTVLIPVFSGLRLAKFNIDTRQTENFIGLATPANALMIVAFSLAWSFQKESAFVQNYVLNSWVLLTLAILSSFLLISPLPMFSLKIKKFKSKENIIRLIFILSSILFVILFGWIGTIGIIPIYIILSLVDFLMKKSGKV